MSSMNFKRLAATTALVSAAVILPGMSHAQTVISTPETTTQATATTGALTVTAGGSINVPGAAAVDFNSAVSGENSLSIDVGRTVTSASAATITTTDDEEYTIVNDGILSNTNGTPVIINAAGGTHNGYITNNGAMTGSLFLGDNGDVVTLGSSSVTTGDIDMGDGQGEIFIRSGAVLNGGITGGSGFDFAYIYGGTITGGIDLGTSSNSMQFLAGNSTINGTITNGGGITLTNSSTAILNGVGAFSSLSIGNGTALTANANQTATGTLTLNGGLTLGSNTTVEVDELNGNVAGANSSLTFGVDNNSAGQLEINNGTNDLSATEFSVVINNGVTVANNTTYTIVDGDDTSTAGTLLTTEQGLYNFALGTADSGNDITITITRDAFGNVVTGNSAVAVAEVLDAIGTGVDDDLDDVQDELFGLSGGYTEAVESLLPPLDTGVYDTIIDVQNTVFVNVSDRLASLRSGMAAGHGGADRHIWVKGFGQDAEHDGNNGNQGYDSDTVGATFGMDKDIKDGTFGVAVTYADSSVNAKSSNNAGADIGSYQASVYGTRNLTDGLFMNWMGALAYNDIETSRTIDVGGFDRNVEGETDGWQVSGKAEFGKDFRLGSATLTPLAGVQYTFVTNDDYTETGAGGASLSVDQENIHVLDLSAGVRSSWAHKTAGGTQITPHVTGMLHYNLGDNNADVTAQFTGGGAAFNVDGVEMNRFGLNLGTGVTWATTGGIDFSVSYDAELRRDYTSHNGFVKARWAF